MDEQKLIYSGQLLNDAHILKDVLRQYEGQDTHTVHLVYTPKNRYAPSTTSSRPIQPKRKETNDNSNQQSRQQSSQPQAQPQPQQSRQTDTAFGSDGLRYANHFVICNSMHTQKKKLIVKWFSYDIV